MNKDLFITIHDWMLDILKGNDLLVFALIYSHGEVTGLKYISERTRIPVENVSRSIKRLEKRKMIVTGTHGANNMTTWGIDETSKPLLTKRQNRLDETSKPLLTNHQNRLDETSKPFLYNNNSYSNSNSYNSKVNSRSLETTATEVLVSLSIPSNNPELVESILGFIDHRKKMKKPLTDRALELNIKKAHKLSNGDVKGMTDLFNLAVERGWQGIFEDKDKKAGERKNESGKHERFFK